MDDVFTSTFEVIFQNAPVPMWIYDLENYKFLAVNLKALKDYGYTYEEFLQKDAFMIRPPHEQERFRKILIEKKAGLHLSGESIHLHKNGSEIMAEVSAIDVTFKNRQARLVFVQNITRVKQSELHLKQVVKDLKDYQQALSNSALIIILDDKGKIMEVNEAFCQVSGFKADQLIGKPYEIMKSSLNNPGQFHEIWNTLQNGNCWKGEILHHKSTGEPFWVETTINPFKNINGKFSRFLAVHFLVTDRKKGEEDKQKLIDLLTEHAFATSHKLRGPLARILGLVQIYNFLDHSDPENKMITLLLKNCAEELDQVVKKMNSKLSKTINGEHLSN
jgi:PAS domain S-box-containing protein